MSKVRHRTCGWIYGEVETIQQVVQKKSKRFAVVAEDMTVAGVNGENAEDRV